MSFLYFKKKHHFGIALIQAMFAIVLGSTISIGVVQFYKNQSGQSEIVQQADQIVQYAEISKSLTKVGQAKDKSFIVHGATLTTTNGKVSVVNMNRNQCLKLSSLLTAKGSVNSFCEETSSKNKLYFVMDKPLIHNKNEENSLSKTEGEQGQNNQVGSVVNTGNVFVNEVPTLTYEASSLFTAEGNSSSNTNNLKNGNSNQLLSNNSGTLTVSATPAVSGDNSNMSCRWRLANNTSYQSSALPSIPAVCGVNQLSVANQTGVRIWSCASPTADANPVHQDIYSGGSCATKCTPAATQNRILSCPANQIGNIYQQNVSICYAPTGSPSYAGWAQTGSTCAWNTSCVGYDSTYAWNGSACAKTCSAPANASLGAVNPSCPAGQVPSTPQYGTRNYYCTSTFGNVASYDTWTTGSCVSSAPVWSNTALCRGNAVPPSMSGCVTGPSISYTIYEVGEAECTYRGTVSYGGGSAVLEASLLGEKVTKTKTVVLGGRTLGFSLYVASSKSGNQIKGTCKVTFIE